MTQVSELGLRERKKIQAKSHIQRSAFALFAKKGYDAATIEQITTAADVSQSTFFRYFPTKEAVVLYDSLDLPLAQVLSDQSFDGTVIEMLRHGAKRVFGNLSAEQATMELQRIDLIRSDPKLRAAMFDELMRNVDIFAAAIAERTGQRKTDTKVRNLAGAIAGVIAVTVMDARKKRTMKAFAKSIDDALAELDNSLVY